MDVHGAGHGRRRVIAGAAAFGVALALRPGARAERALVRTAPQTTGPFYPRELPLDRDNDLARVAGAPQGAKGVISHVGGRLLDEDGRAIPGARIEIWQCNAFGRYHHPEDRRDAPIDPGFQGYGETASASDGAYRFRTIKPVPYPGRTPHIHFAVTAPGERRLVTQMYVDGAPENARDFLLNGIRDEAQRRAVIVAFHPADTLESGALAAIFNIVLARDPRFQPG